MRKKHQTEKYLSKFRYRVEKHTKKSKRGCWRWIGPRDPLGYGRVSYWGKAGYTHHAAWILANGSIPEGKHVLHKCDNRGCINPKHLYIGTHQDNINDRELRGRGTNKLTAFQKHLVSTMIKRKIPVKRIASYFSVDRFYIYHLRRNLK